MPKDSDSVSLFHNCMVLVGLLVALYLFVESSGS